VGVKFSPPLVISPDGERMVMVTGASVVTAELHYRSLDEFGWRVLPETGNGDMPFFSPDGEWIGYFANGELKKMRVSGGPAVTIGRIQLLRAGATWGPDGTIVFGSAGSGLKSIPAEGGAARPLSSLGEEEGQHWWPQFLPDGSAVVFTVNRANRHHIAVLDMDTGQHRVLEGLGAGRAARYVETGHLVFVSKGRLVSAGFDAGRLEVTSPPEPVAGVDDIHVSPGSGLPYFAVSRRGHLAYVAGALPGRTLVRVDREGASTPLTEERGHFTNPRFSPDGTRVAVAVNVQRTWIYDLASGTRSPLTARTQSSSPAWGPGPDSVTFTTGNWLRVHWTRVGEGADTALLESGGPVMPAAWTPDGSALVFEGFDSGRRNDIGMVTLDGDVRSLLASDFKESYPDLSPDGRWIAYLSDESGQDEVYVDRFPELGQRVPISIGGGGEPLWSPRGDELFYRHDDRLMAVSVTTTPRLRPGRPRELFRGPYLSPVTKGGEGRTYDVAPDGESFLMLEVEDVENPMELRVILNWLDELKTERADD
jgi:serine/threonine-protein kinase